MTGKTCINAAVYQLDSMFAGTVRYSPTMTYASQECPQDLSLSQFQCHMTVRDNKGVSTIEATEAAASVIFSNSYMYSQLSTLHRVDYNTYDLV